MKITAAVKQLLSENWRTGSLKNMSKLRCATLNPIIETVLQVIAAVVN